MATQIQLRRGTASAWTTANPILAVGEMGLETDTGRFKVGNGSSTWTALVYSSGLTGPQGFQGSTGAQGVLGAQGPTGAQGAVGTQGAQGSQGILGTQGVQGSQGNQGSQGAQGSAGVTGAQGNQGFQGVTGAQGIQTSATAPIDTSILWADTTTTGAAGTVPSGGTIGQVLAKNSGTNYDTTWASVGSAARPLLTGGAYLSGSGLVLSGITANYASTPDSAALSVTGDIDIAVRVALDDWTPASTGHMFSKWPAAGNRSFAFQINTSGTFTFFTSVDGTANVSASSTVAPTIADGAPLWIRVTRSSSTGDVNFYTAADGTSVPSSWTQLGTANRTTAAGGIFNGNGIVTVGTDGAGGYSAAIFYRAIVKNGIAGTTVFDADFSTQTADALAFTESSANAATVTINTTRYSYGLPNSPYTGASTLAINPNIDYFFPFQVSKRTVVDMAMFEVTTGPASNSTVHIGLYPADENMQSNGSVITNFGPITVPASTTGVFSQQVAPVTLEAGTYIIGINVSVGFTFRTVRSPNAYIAQTMGTAPVRRLLSKSRTNATFPTTDVAWTASTLSSVGWDQFVFLRYKAAT